MKWISLKKEKPKDELDNLGKKRQFLLGYRDMGSRINHVAVCYIDNYGQIIERESSKYANMTYWTHWAEIEEVPEFKP